MKNTCIRNATDLTSFITAMAHTGLQCKCENCTKPKEQKQQRQKENTYLVNEIANSLITARI